MVLVKWVEMCKNNFSLIWDKAIYFISKMPGGFVWTYVNYFLCYIISITIGCNSCSFILESFTTEISICFALKSIKNPFFINLSYFTSYFVKKNKMYKRYTFHYVSIKDYRKTNWWIVQRDMAALKHFKCWYKFFSSISQTVIW